MVFIFFSYLFSVLGFLGWTTFATLQLVSYAPGILDALGRTQVQKLRSMGLRQRDVQDVLNEAWFFTRWLWRDFLVGMPVKLLWFLAFRGHRLVDIASKS